MSELKDIVAAARRLRAANEPLLLATVVAVRGSAYRRAGARMLVHADRWLAGSLSGGCVERMILTQGAFRTRHARAVLATYEGAPDEREGSGCEGEIDVLIERLNGEPSPGDPLRFLERCLGEERAGILVSVVRSTQPEVAAGARAGMLAPNANAGFPAWDVASDAPALNARLTPLFAEWQANSPRRAHTFEHAGLTLLVEPVTPPPHLFVFGSAHDAPALIALASQLGWSVTAWDAKPSAATRARLSAADAYFAGSLQPCIAAFERCAVPLAIVMGHDYAQDREALAALCASSARYLGVLGPRARTERLLADCAARGIVPGPALRARLFGPAGLALGAETPAEIALSIVAQMQAVLAGTQVGALRDVAGPIHAHAGNS